MFRIAKYRKSAAKPTYNLQETSRKNSKEDNDHDHDTINIKKHRRIDLENDEHKATNETSFFQEERTQRHQERIQKNFSIIILKFLKSVFSLNSYLLFWCAFHTPLSILTILYRDCDSKNGECHTFIQLIPGTTLVRFLTFVLGCFVLYYKIERNSQ